jgi:hypothetical protein
MGYKTKEAQREASRRHYEKNKAQYRERDNRRREIIRELIADVKCKPCADCNISYPYYVMDLDHLDSETKVLNLSQLRVLGSIEEIKIELKKCEPVCSNCHRIRTAKRAGYA